MADATAVTNITIDFWQFVMSLGGVVVVIVIILIVAGQMLLNQLDRRSSERDEARKSEQLLRDEALQLRLQGHDEELASVNDKAEQIERDVRQLATMLPNEYVRREDWIRFSNTIDHKLDRLNDKGEATRDAMASMAANVKARLGDANGR
jgi:chromosome segregation ATPase